MQPTLVDEIHEKYSNLPGGEQVALKYSISQLNVLLQQNKHEKILELGGGLGTLTELILRTTNAKLTVVENNSWCAQQLIQNTREFRDFKLIKSYNELNSATDCTLLVIDVNNGIFNVEKLVENSPAIKEIFIEGHHLAHRMNVSRSILRMKKTQSLMDLRPKRGAKGCALFLISHDNSLFHISAKYSFIKVYLPILTSYIVVKTRKKTGQILDHLSFVPGVTKIRSIWLGKLPWNF